MVYHYPTDKIYICGPGWQNPQFSDFCLLLCLIHHHCKSPTSLVLQLWGTFSAPQSCCYLFLSHVHAISHTSPFSPDSYNSLVPTSLSSECLIRVIKIKLGFLVYVCYGTLSPFQCEQVTHFIFTVLSIAAISLGIKCIKTGTTCLSSLYLCTKH